MRQSWVGGTLVMLAAATFVVGCMTFQRVGAGLLDPPRVEALGRSIARELTTVQTLTATWVSGGIQQVLNTPERADDGPGDLVARHKVRLAEALAAFPKDP